jgi:hypothetical protein
MTIIESDTAAEADTKPKARRPKVQAVAIHEPQAVASPNPVSIVERAIERGLTGADLKEIMDLQERWEASQARKAFDLAMANAQAEIPTIVRNRLVAFEAKSGGKDTSYRHEDLANIVETIRPILHKHGLSHRFKTHQDMTNGGLITVTCIITGHGHRDETPLSSGPDQNGSGMNNLQRIASTVTYLERYTLKAALGLAAAHDDDGAKSEAAPATITALQMQELEALAIEVNANVPAACKYLKIESLAELPAAKFDRAKQLLEAKRTQL